MLLLNEGDLFDRRYRIQRRIGSGGMSHVFAAEDEELAETVALKIIKPDFAEDEEFVTRFKREVRIARQLLHPNIVRVFEFGRTEIGGSQLYYLTMELLKGRDLGAWLRAQRPAAMADVLRIGLQLCDALHEAHRAGVIHRDIKPQNIFVEAKEQIKLMDFGISRFTSLPSVTQGGKLIGTPRYMSPEQIHGRTSPDHRSDLYSVGIVLYELSTRRKPFEGENTIEIAMKQLQETPQRPREVNPRVPAALDQVIMRCLEKEPTGRYQSAAELRAALEVVLAQPDAPSEKTVAAVQTPGGEVRPAEIPDTRTDRALPRELEARPSATTRTSAKEVRKRPRRNGMVGLSLAAVVMVGVVSIGVYRWLRPEPTPASVSETPTEEPVGQPAVPTESGPPEPADEREPSPTTARAERPEPLSTSTAPPPATSSVSPRPRPAASTGALHVTSSPSGASVSIDGREVGTTPWQGELAPGDHQVRIAHPGYVPQDQRVTVRTGETVEQNLRLSALQTTARTSISANPGTEIYVDGRSVGRIPPVVELTLPTGRHTLRYVLPDYDEYEETVEVRPNQVNTFAHRFPLFGSVRIMAVPYAQVILDGEDRGFTPVNLDKVPEGPHQLVLRREGFETIEVPITVRPGEVNRYNYTLAERKR